MKKVIMCILILCMLIAMPLLVGATELKDPVITSTPYQETTATGEVRNGLLIHVSAPGMRTFTFLVIDNELFLNG